MRKIRRDYIFLIPSLFIVLFFVLYPLSQTFYLSLFNWNGYTPPRFIGLRNFVALFSDSTFIAAVRNNFIWVGIFLVANNLIGLFLAGSIDILGRRMTLLARSVIYLTTLLPTLVVSFIWLGLYDPNIGLIDSFLRSIGLTSLAQTQWLSNQHIALYSILTSSIWQFAAWPMLIFLAAFAGISGSVYEAAVVDGASQWTIFWRIKVPLIRPVILIIFVLTWIWNSMAFSQVWTMTGGVPSTSTNVIVTYMYSVAFLGLELGYASAIAVILFFIIFPAVVLVLRVFER